jgi:hypothetical protein
MTTSTPGLPVSERTLRAFGHHRPSIKGASLRKESANFGIVTHARILSLTFTHHYILRCLQILRSASISYPVLKKVYHLHHQPPSWHHDIRTTWVRPSQQQRISYDGPHHQSFRLRATLLNHKLRHIPNSGVVYDESITSLASGIAPCTCFYIFRRFYADSVPAPGVVSMARHGGRNSNVAK